MSDPRETINVIRPINDLFNDLYNNKLFRHVAIVTTAGGLAGMIETAILHPFDVVKTRFQIHGYGKAKLYLNMTDCFRQMILHEGPLSIYKGIGPPTLTALPKRGVKFCAFEEYRCLFANNGKETVLSVSFAGMFAGMTEAIMINASEVIKVRQQACQNRFALSTWQMGKKIYNEGGWKALNIGLTATMLRNAAFNFVYFGMYYTTRDLLERAPTRSGLLMQQVSLGFAAGTVASVFNMPFDVVKSRIQSSSGTDLNDKTFLRTATVLYRENGYKVFFRGFQPKLLRLGPGGGIIIVCYETLKERFERYWVPL